MSAGGGKWNACKRSEARIRKALFFPEKESKKKEREQERERFSLFRLRFYFLILFYKPQFFAHLSTHTRHVSSTAHIQDT
jgi:hypothetical protein